MTSDKMPISHRLVLRCGRHIHRLGMAGQRLGALMIRAAMAEDLTMLVCPPGAVSRNFPNRKMPHHAERIDDQGRVWCPPNNRWYF